MSDVLALPEFSLGVPLPDCNLSRPSLQGVHPPWAGGVKVAGHIDGLHPAPSMSSFTGLQESNPNGSGRSIRVLLQSDMNADASSYLRTGPTYYGWVPSLGVVYPVWRPSIWMIANFNLTAGQQVQVKIRQYDADDVPISVEHTIATFGSGSNTNGAWKSFAVQSPSSLSTLAACRYFRLYFYFDANGLGTQNAFGLDFVGLGWYIGTAAGNDIVDNYQPDGYQHGAVSSVEMIGHGISEAMQSFPLGSRRGVTLEEVWAIRYERCTVATRDALNFFWRAGRGTPSGNDKNISGRGELIGKHWPILIRPNRPGVKEAFYAIPMDDTFPLSVDASAGFVESESRYSGTMLFREQSY